MDKKYIDLNELQIGDYVDYKPEEGDYVAEACYSGYSTDQSFSTETKLKWRVWNFNSDSLYLICDKTTSRALSLKGTLGYNNGVTLLDNICNSCYKNSHYREMTVRNLKIEDIVSITNKSNMYSGVYGNQPYQYTYETPYIWSKYEKNSKSDALNNRSTGYILTTNTKSNSMSIMPYCTTWSNYDMNTTNAYTNSKYKELVIDAMYCGDYWLSSRGFQAWSEQACSFNMHRVWSKRCDGRQAI